MGACTGNGNADKEQMIITIKKEVFGLMISAVLKKQNACPCVNRDGEVVLEKREHTSIAFRYQKCLAKWLAVQICNHFRNQSRGPSGQIETEKMEKACPYLQDKSL